MSSTLILATLHELCGRRSEHLFAALTKRWRYLGGVRLITGMDLAHAAIAPHQFLAFLSCRLAQLFVRDQESLERSMAELANARDADGRFRISNFFVSPTHDNLYCSG